MGGVIIEWYDFTIRVNGPHLKELYDQYGSNYDDYYFAKDLYAKFGETSDYIENFRLYNHSTVQDRFDVNVYKYGWRDDIFGFFTGGIFDNDPPYFNVLSNNPDIVIPSETYFEFYFEDQDNNPLFPISYTVDSVISGVEITIGGEIYIWSYDNPTPSQYKPTDNPVIKTTKEIQGIDIIKNLQFEFDETVYNPKNFSINFGS